MDGYTPRLGLLKPTYDADYDAWGGMWNTNADIIDAAWFGTSIGAEPPAGAPPGAFWWDVQTGNLYIRYQDADSTQWVAATYVPPNALGDAPTDGVAYGRLSGVWVPVLPLTGGTMAGPLTLAADPAAALGAATKQYADARQAAAQAYADATFLPLAGGALTGQLTLPFGTSAAPSLTFSGMAANSGIFATGAVINIGINGNSRLAVSQTQVTTPQVFRTTDGTNPSPAHSFISETGMGMYRNGAGILGFAVGGVNPLLLTAAGATVNGSLTTTGNVLLPFGTAAAPSLTFTGSTTTGIYGAAGAINFTVNNAARFTVFQSSLSASVPLRALDGTNAIPALSFITETGMGMYRNAAGILGFAAGGANPLLLSATAARFLPGAVAAPSANWGFLGTGLYGGGATEAGATVSIAQNGTERMRFSSGAIINVFAFLRNSDGVIATPPYSFQNEIGMGMYRNAAGTLGLAVGGVNAALLTATLATFPGAIASGAVGIGRPLPPGTAPTASMLAVYDAIFNGSIGFNTYFSGGWKFYDPGGAALMQFDPSAGTPAMTMYVATNTGIAGAAATLASVFSFDTSRKFTLAGSLAVTPLPASASYADDTAAAAGGVAVGEFYRNGSAVQVRVA